MILHDSKKSHGVDSLMIQKAVSTEKPGMNQSEKWFEISVENCINKTFSSISLVMAI